MGPRARAGRLNALFFCVAAVVLVGCEDRPVATAVKLLGARVVDARPSPHRFVFDDEWPVGFAVQPSNASVPKVWWVDDSGRHELECETRKAQEALFLTCGVHALDEGPGHLMVGGTGARWPVAKHRAPRAYDAVARALEEAAVGRRQVALQILSQTSSSGQRWQRIWAADVRASMLYETGKLAPMHAAEEAARIAVELDAPSQAGRRYRTAMHLASRAGRVADAQRFRVLAEAYTADLPVDHARLLGEQAGFLLDRERYREAEQSYLQAIHAANAAGVDPEPYASALALLFIHLGRYEEAQFLMTSYPPASRGARAERAANEAEMLVRQMRAKERPMTPERVDALLATSEQDYRAESLLHEALDRRVEAAWWAAETGRFALAREQLEVVGATVPDATAPLFYLARARVQAAFGDLAVARAGLVELTRTSTSEGGLLVAMRAQVQLAEMAAAEGEAVAAARHFHRAVDLLMKISLRSGLRSSSSRYLASTDPVRARALEAYILAGEVLAGLALSDRARALVLDRLVKSAITRRPEVVALLERSKSDLLRRTLEGCPGEAKVEQDECWAQLQVDLHAWAFASQEALEEPQVPMGPRMPDVTYTTPPTPGTGVLTLEKVGGLWRGLWTRGEGLRTATATSALGPWHLDLRGHVEHVFVVTDHLGVIEDFVQAVPPGGTGPTYSVVPSIAWLAETTTTAAGHFAVVAPQRSELPAANSEADWIVRHVSNAKRVRPARAAELFQGASSVHFAGHGLLVGSDPWSTWLDLGSAALSLEDLLLAQPKLSLVVLNGCSTGAIRRPHDLGLPQGLLALGTRTVVATLSPARDVTARSFVQTFYRSGGATRPGPAFRAAQDELRGLGNSGWRNYRLWGWP